MARDLLLLAMASLSKLLIVTLRPDLRVTYIHALYGDAQTLPLLAWHFVTVQLSDKRRVVDPVLAFARDQTVYFVQVGRVLISLQRRRRRAHSFIHSQSLPPCVFVLTVSISYAPQQHLNLE